MTRIIINESQLRVLAEAAKESFNVETLSQLRNFSQKVKYCKQELGLPVGKGTSRLVFQIDDEKVLKLAINDKGIAQNEEEGRPDYYKDAMSIFPKVYQYDENFQWIISEYVLPANSADFKQCLGMSFNDWKMVISAIQKELTGRRFMPSIPSEELYKLCEENPFVEELNDYVHSYDVGIGDLYAIRNYGLAKRDGKPAIVLLDSGLSQYVFDTYYKRR